MAIFFNEPSRTFSEYLLIPGYTSEECIPSNVSLRTPLTKYRKGVEEPAISLNIPILALIAMICYLPTFAKRCNLLYKIV